MTHFEKEVSLKNELPLDFITDSELGGLCFFLPGL